MSVTDGQWRWLWKVKAHWTPQEKMQLGTARPRGIAAAQFDLVLPPGSTKPATTVMEMAVLHADPVCSRLHGLRILEKA